MYILYSSTFIWSTKYNQKYTVHPKVHKSTFGCAVYPVSISCRKNWSIHVNVPLGVLSTFKSESAKYIPRYKVHPKAKVQSTPCMHVSIIFLRIRLQQKRKVHSINCDVLENIILTSSQNFIWEGRLMVHQRTQPIFQKQQERIKADKKKQLFC